MKCLASGAAVALSSTVLSAVFCVYILVVLLRVSRTLREDMLMFSLQALRAYVPTYPVYRGCNSSTLYRSFSWKGVLALCWQEGILGLVGAIIALLLLLGGAFPPVITIQFVSDS